MDWDECVSDLCLFIVCVGMGDAVKITKIWRMKSERREKSGNGE